MGEAFLNSKVVQEAIGLRKKYQLTYFDSLHAAMATLHDGAIISTDKAYMRIKELKAIDPEGVTGDLSYWNSDESLQRKLS
ncbi:MAG: hypothetical protein QXI39_09970 [Candidatus Bathyarchaeia archaeon]